MMGTPGKQTRRLLRYDGKILLGLLRQLVGNARDALLFSGFLLIVLTMLAHEVASQPIGRILPAVSVAAVVLGGLVDWMLRRRMSFHCRETSLAPAALTSAARTRYRLAGHCLVLVAGIVFTATIRLSLTPFLVGGWLLGAAGASLVACLFPGLINGEAGASRGRFGPVEFRRNRRRMMQTLALIAFAIAGLAYVTDLEEAAGIAGFVVFLHLAVFTPIDHRTINFERISGYGVTASLKRNLLDALVATLVLSAAALISLESFYLVSVAAPCLVVLLYRALQIMVFRIFSMRLAELMLVFVLWGIILVGLMMPLFLLPLLAVMLALIGRRASRLTWSMP